MTGTSIRKFMLIPMCLIFLGILVSACVSVRLPTAGVSRPNLLKYQNPSSPYEQFYPEHLDFAWKDQDGRTIGVLTECSDEDDVNLEAAQRSLAESVQGARIKSQNWTEVDKIKALRTVIHSGEAKASTGADVVLFRSKDCTFVLSYVAPLAKFKSGTATFDAFLGTVEVEK